jgi:predicted metalloprotease
MILLSAVAQDTRARAKLSRSLAVVKYASLAWPPEGSRAPTVGVLRSRLRSDTLAATVARLLITLSLSAVALLVVTACGDDSPSNGPADALAEPTGVDMLDELSPSQPPVSIPMGAPPVEQPELTPSEYIAAMGQDAQQFWLRLFSDAGYMLRPGAQRVVDTDVQSRCNARMSPEDDPIYCEYDDPPTLYLPLAWLESKIGDIGKFAYAYIVAHEWGHHVQNSLRVFELQRRYPSRIKDIHIELQADCFAGVWARHLFRANRIGQEEVDAAFRVGERLQDVGPQDSPGAHGTARQRQSWFRRGFDSGRSADCKTWTGKPPNPVALGT